MNKLRHPALQTATGWLLALAFVFTCGVPVTAKGSFQKSASFFHQKDAEGRTTNGDKGSGDKGSDPGQTLITLANGARFAGAGSAGKCAERVGGELVRI